MGLEELLDEIINTPVTWDWFTAQNILWGATILFIIIAIILMVVGG